jgi:hypothetical protein
MTTIFRCRVHNTSLRVVKVEVTEQINNVPDLTLILAPCVRCEDDAYERGMQTAQRRVTDATHDAD